jgi:hypothetical protein
VHFFEKHGRMARGGHRLLKVSLGPVMLDPSMPCGQDTPETALHLQPFQGWSACRAGNLRPSSTLLDTPRHTPMQTTLLLDLLGFQIGIGFGLFLFFPD